MKKNLYLVLILLSTNLFALECNEASFNKGNDEMKSA
jgi:hypothetical protein